MFDLGNRKVILYGAALLAEKYYYSLCRSGLGGVIKGICDKREKGFFHGYQIFNSINSLFKKGDLVVVTCRKETYYSIKRDLIEEGLIEYNDFIWMGYLYKKICVINANCFGEALKHHLDKSKAFRETYEVAYCTHIAYNTEGEIGDDLLMHTDLLFHQDVREENPYGKKLSDDYILHIVGNDCKKVCIPNFVGMYTWLFPTMMRQQYKINDRVLVLYKDKLLEEAYNKGERDLDRIENYINKNCPTADELTCMFEDGIKKIREREKKWDITISDEIIKSYRTQRIACDYDHPTGKWMRYYCEKICNLIGINDIPDEYDEDEYYYGHDGCR